jgi:hypothetical protein
MENRAADAAPQRDRRLMRAGARIRIGPAALTLPPLPLAAALVGTFILFAYNVLDSVAVLAANPRHTDFHVYYVAAQIGRALGTPQMYNTAVFLPAVLSASGREVPYLNPPLLAWLVTPLAALGYPFALTLWLALLAASILLAWRLAAPGNGLTRWVYLLAPLSVYSIFLAFRLGQVTYIVIAGVAVCWWLMRRGRPWWAGVALATILLKPQVAFLVPVTLLVAGYWRVVCGWALVSVPAALLSLVFMGSSGVQYFRQASALAVSMIGSRQVTVLNATGSPTVALVGALLAAGIALAVAFRSRGRGPELPVAAGLIGTLLVSPYVNGVDLVALALAAWLVLRTDPPTWQRALLLAGYLELTFLVFVGAWLTLALEGVWLASLLVLAGLPLRHHHQVRART